MYVDHYTPHASHKQADLRMDLDKDTGRREAHAIKVGVASALQIHPPPPFATALPAFGQCVARISKLGLKASKASLPIVVRQGLPDFATQEYTTEPV